MVAVLDKPSLDLALGREWWRAFLYVNYYCGMRTGEILALKWPDIVDDFIKVRAGGSKSRKDRPIPIDKALKKILDAYRPHVTSVANEVFPYAYADWKKHYAAWHVIQNAAGIKEEDHFVPKDGRSTFCSELAAQQVSTATVKALAGHATMATTERYYINPKPGLKAAIAKRKVAIKRRKPKSS